MNRIASFSVDHDLIVPGIYISRIDGDITTYDLRTRKPNTGDLMDNAAMHSMEHMFATFVRNSALGDDIIYFGPMGCRTGFYLVMAGDLDSKDIVDLMLKCFEFCRDFEGEIPGQAPEDCGNWLDHNLPMAKYWSKLYLDRTLYNIDDAHLNYPLKDE